MTADPAGNVTGSGAGALWDPDLWEPLIASLKTKRVVPIIGPELALGLLDGAKVTIGDYVANALASELHIDIGNLRQPSVNDVVRFAKLRSGGNDDVIYAKISRILATAPIEPSPVLRTIARITDIKLYVTLSYDTLLERAVEAERGVRCDRTLNSYYPPDAPDCDLNWASDPVVYYLLGRHSPMPDFAVSDGDLIETMLGLHSANAPMRLLDYLKGSYLLFLGGAFPDWLLRFLLRSIRQKPLGRSASFDRTMDILADSLSHQDSNLVGFLSAFSTKTRVFDADAETFVDELWKRWSVGSSNQVATLRPSPADALLDPDVFISFASEDLAAASRVADLLTGAGLRVWLDRGNLFGGSHIDDTITSAIARSRLFVPLVSRTTERRTTNAYFNLEWRRAARRAELNAPSSTFIFPVIIDDLAAADIRATHLPFDRILVRKARDGELSPDLVREISSYCRGLVKS